MTSSLPTFPTIFHWTVVMGKKDMTSWLVTISALHLALDAVRCNHIIWSFLLKTPPTKSHKPLSLGDIFMFHVFFKSLTLSKSRTHFSKQQGVCNNSSHQLHRRQEIPDLKRFVSIFMSVWRLLIPSRVRNLRWNNVMFSSVVLCLFCIFFFSRVVCVCIIHVGYCSFWSEFVSYFEVGYGMELCTGRTVVKQGWTLRKGISYGRQTSERWLEYVSVSKRN